AERKAIQMAMWDMVPSERWLNSPDRMQRASRKLMQLELARRIGFHIPKTLTTNTWQAIGNLLPQQVIYKTSYPLFYKDGEVLSLFTTPFENSPDALPHQQNPYPGIWQEYLKKAREWRITVVGD